MTIRHLGHKTNNLAALYSGCTCTVKEKKNPLWLELPDVEPYIFDIYDLEWRGGGAH